MIDYASSFSHLAEALALFGGGLIVVLILSDSICKRIK